MPLSTSRAEMRLATIYAAFLCTACVLLLNIFVLGQSSNQSALVGTWADWGLQRVSAFWVAIGLACPIAVALIRQISQRRWGNAVLLVFCMGSTLLSVWMLVFMLQV